MPVGPDWQGSCGQGCLYVHVMVADHDEVSRFAPEFCGDVSQAFRVWLVAGDAVVSDFQIELVVNAAKVQQSLRRQLVATGPQGDAAPASAQGLQQFRDPVKQRDVRQVDDALFNEVFVCRGVEFRWEPVGEKFSRGQAQANPAIIVGQFQIMPCEQPLEDREVKRPG